MLTKIKLTLLLIMLLFITSCGVEKNNQESNKKNINGIGIKEKSFGGEAITKGENTVVSNLKLEVPLSKPNIIK